MYDTLQQEYRNNSTALSQVKQSEDKTYQLTVELNHAQKKCDSLSRELKKVIKESQDSQLAYRKALDAKTDEVMVC
jgi:hypothetical protein